MKPSEILRTGFLLVILAVIAYLLWARHESDVAANSRHAAEQAAPMGGDALTPEQLQYVSNPGQYSVPLLSGDVNITADVNTSSLSQQYEPLFGFVGIAA